jgi:hypothetical protein
MAAGIVAAQPPIRSVEMPRPKIAAAGIIARNPTRIDAQKN